MENDMNIELDEVVEQDVSDDALELAAVEVWQGTNSMQAYQCF